MRSFMVLMFVLGSAGGCESKKLGVAGSTCSAASDCADDLQCVGSVCVMTGAAGVVQAMQTNGKVFADLAEAKKKAAASDVFKLQAAAEQYLQKGNECPKSTADLKAAGVVARAQKDPWGQEFMFTCPGQNAAVDVTSHGPNQAAGGGDDITTATVEQQ